MTIMQTRSRLFAALLLLAAPVFAQERPDPIRISAETLGDTAGGVATRVVFRLAIPPEVPPEAPLVLQGSLSHAGKVLRTFRYMLPESNRDVVRAVMQLPPGNVSIEARLMIDVPDSTPVTVAKQVTEVSISARGTAYVADASDGAEAVIAEGPATETAGAIRIRPPRRDVAPNLFIVDVDVKAPATRVEFFVEGKKVVVRNAPPYRAEVDLGPIPKRVEVKAVGYDKAGRYVDADSFIVNERETPLEVKIARTGTPEGVIHFKLSVQNPQGRSIRSVILYAGEKKLAEWTRAPYATSVGSAQLQGVDFVRASVIDETGYEASDLLFLSGERFMEEIDVNIVELPVSVTDAAGAPIANLAQSNFAVFEDGKPQKISTFNFASNLPIAVGVLMDRSGSMKPRLAQAKEAATTFLTSIVKPGDRAFIGGFSFDTATLAPFVGDVSLLRQQVDGIADAEGGTSLYDAIVTGLYRFRNVQGRKALVLLTDGEDTTSRLSYDDMLVYARAARVPLYFIGVGMGFGDRGGTSKMRALAAETGGVAYFIKDVKDLTATYRELERELRSQYLLTYSTESSKKDTKYRTVEVKVDKPDAKVRTIRGFIP